MPELHYVECIVQLDHFPGYYYPQWNSNTPIDAKLLEMVERWCDGSYLAHMIRTATKCMERTAYRLELHVSDIPRGKGQRRVVLEGTAGGGEPSISIEG